MKSTLPAEKQPPVLPSGRPVRLGIIGGGQLARMLAQAARPLGCEVTVLERTPDCPAAQISPGSMVGDWNDPATLLAFARQCDVLTLENEFVDARALALVEAAGHPLFPTAASLALTQDKLIQKQTLQNAGLPVATFRAVQTMEEVQAAGASLGWPLLLKTRRNGYDGKGNVTLRSAAEAPAGWRQLGGGGNDLYVEAFCHFKSELAVIVTRGQAGETAVYPVVETVQRHHVCHSVQAPADLAPEVAARAAELARRAIAAVGAIGSFGVELFLEPNGGLIINELAPRVHNSGHYTIEACECSQFENHIRAVLGWPLGRPRMLMPAAVMLNLLGPASAPGQPQGLAAALGVPGAHLHLYGKAESAPGRKMGHITALGATGHEAMHTALAAAREIQFTKAT
jgi:5-(carboxyamino)imidazole ribonucleotide synthase